MLRGLKNGYNGCFTGYGIGIFTMPGFENINCCVLVDFIFAISK